MLFVSYNIQYSRGRDGRYDLARTLAAVSDADIIALQEVERNWRRTGMSDQPAEISALLPDRYWVYGAPFDVDVSTGGPDGRIVNRRRQFGQMILSRWPIVSSRLHVLAKLNSGAYFNLDTGALEAVIATPQEATRVYNVHLSHVSAEERLLQIEDLFRILQRTPAGAGAWNGREVDPEHWETIGDEPAMPAEAILLGDFNAEPDSREYAILTRPSDAGADGWGADVQLVDAWIAAGHGRRDGVTFYRDVSQGAHSDLRIDYCFVPRSRATQVKRAWIDADAVGSDHQPVWVDIDR